MRQMMMVMHMAIRRWSAVLIAKWMVLTGEEWLS